MQRVHIGDVVAVVEHERRVSGHPGEEVAEEAASEAVEVEASIRCQQRQAARASADLWASCIGGALTEGALVDLLTGCGLHDARITERFECFAGTDLARKFHGQLHAYGANVLASRP